MAEALREGLRFDTEDEAEYPWEFCTTYALRVAMGRRTPRPVGLVERDHLLFGSEAGHQGSGHGCQ